MSLATSSKYLYFIELLPMGVAILPSSTWDDPQFSSFIRFNLLYQRVFLYASLLVPSFPWWYHCSTPSFPWRPLRGSSSGRWCVGSSFLRSHGSRPSNGVQVLLSAFHVFTHMFISMSSLIGPISAMYLLGFNPTPSLYLRLLLYFASHP